MIETYFISDTHFGHKNILEYEKEARPFDSLEEMNQKIIENWNKTVRPKDIIYHLGDFAFGRDNIAIASRLNGRKKLILGNHDLHDIRLYLHYFEGIYGALHWKKCVMTHIPVHPDNLGRRFLINIHGHLHSRTIKDSLGLPAEYVDDPKYFNVSCERNNLTPIHADVIRERLRAVYLPL